MHGLKKTAALALPPAQSIIVAFAALFFLFCTWGSYAQWANFRYRTFDLAFYAQGVWQFLHGRFAVTVEPIPLMGNHVEPIVFLFAPFLAIFRHPMVFVVVQNLALATMGPVGFDIARRLGFGALESLLLAISLLLAPTAGFVALHEFHPEALAAPLLLLLLRARIIRLAGQYWFWFAALLTCKENMALLLGAYCLVHLFTDRKLGFAKLRTFYVFPLICSILWFLLCISVITPALNSGEIDYLGLYSRLGSSVRDILLNAVTKPQLIVKALAHSLTHGNLLWALLLPFLCLPLLAPRWLLISAPILLQHLLSWRSSEWNIYFHYGAPLLPLFWIATVEVVARFKATQKTPGAIRIAAANDRGNNVILPALIVLGCLVAQVWIGPAGDISSATVDWFRSAKERARKTAFIDKIPPQASVIAPFPYLSHLATREKLYSLHHILKGLKTLSRAPFEPPPPPDFVVIDYGDFSTFDASSGYYHPTMKMTDGSAIASSDQRLHDLLKQRSWFSYSVDELTLLQQDSRPTGAKTAPSPPGQIADLGQHTQLLSATTSEETAAASDGSIEIKTTWNFDADRAVFPWLFLRLTNRSSGNQVVFNRGLCAPEAVEGHYKETWHITSLNELSPGNYSLEAIFVDNTRRVWNESAGKGRADSALLARPIAIGELKITRPPTSATGTE